MPCCSLLISVLLLQSFCGACSFRKQTREQLERSGGDNQATNESRKPLQFTPCGVYIDSSGYGDIKPSTWPAGVDEVWFYPKEAADHNEAFSLTKRNAILARLHSNENNGCTTAVHHIETVSEGTKLVDQYPDGSVRIAVIGGHGNGLRVKWGDGRCHETDMNCGFFQNLYGDPFMEHRPLLPGEQFLKHLLPKLTLDALVILDSCFASRRGGIPVTDQGHSLGTQKNNLAKWVARRLPSGMSVLGPSDCYRQQDFRRSMSDVYAGFSIRIKHKELLRRFPGVLGCEERSWSPPRWLRRGSFQIDSCDDVTATDTICEDDEDDEEFNAFPHCCLCGGRKW